MGSIRYDMLVNELTIEGTTYTNVQVTFFSQHEPLEVTDGRVDSYRKFKPGIPAIHMHINKLSSKKRPGAI